MKKLLPQFVLLLFCVIFNLNTYADVPPRGIIKGRVVNSNSRPVDNATITLQGTRFGALTNDDGTFELSVPAGNYTLIVSHIGAEPVNQSVEVRGGQTIRLNDIAINFSKSALEEVQINGERTNHFKTKKSYDVSKQSLNNLESAQSYTTVTKELIQEQAVFSADGAVRNVAGISPLWTPTNRAGDGGSYFTLRGFPTAIQLTNGVAGTVSNTIDATNLERVEVIKGPSGTLYGSTLASFGGLVNRVTKRPYDYFGGNITYSAGSYSFNRISLDLNTPLDSTKRALLRINTSYNGINSFQDAGFDRRFVFAPSFSYQVNDKLSLLFNLEALHGRSTTPPIFYLYYNATVAQLGVNRADQLSIDYKKAYYTNSVVINSDNVNFTGQANYKFSDQWNSQTNVSSNYSSSDGIQPYYYLLAGNSSISRNIWDVTGNTSAIQLQQNFNGDFRIGDLRNRLLIGLDFINQRGNIAYSSPPGYGLFDVVNTRGGAANYYDLNKFNVDRLYNSGPLPTPYMSVYNRYTTSAYASDVLNITDNLLVSAGLRVDHFKNNSVYDPTLNNYSAQGYNQTSVSPKFGLVYQVIKDQLSLFGNYQNGFINPGYYSAYDASAPGGLSLRTAKTQNANQAEGGIKADLFGGKLSGTVSYYNISVSNILRADPLHANAQSQDGTQRSRGIEAEVIANPIAGLNIVAGYAFNDSRIEKSTSYDEGYRPATAGAPRQANFYASYRLLSGPAQGVGVGFGGNYASDNKVINNSFNGTFILPAYTVLNANVFLDKPRYRIGFNVNNLTDKHYWIGYTTVNPQMLRQFIGSISYKF